jgi:hypothetical protein
LRHLEKFGQSVFLCKTLTSGTSLPFERAAPVHGFPLSVHLLRPFMTDDADPIAAPWRNQAQRAPAATNNSAGSSLSHTLRDWIGRGLRKEYRALPAAALPGQLLVLLSRLTRTVLQKDKVQDGRPAFKMDQQSSKFSESGS